MATKISDNPRFTVVGENAFGPITTNYGGGVKRADERAKMRIDNSKLSDEKKAELHAERNVIAEQLLGTVKDQSVGPAERWRARHAYELFNQKMKAAGA